MEGYPINFKQIKVPLKNGIGKMPCPFQQVIRIEVPGELCPSMVTVTKSKISFKRSFFQSMADFLYPKHVTVFYSETFDNSVHPMLLKGGTSWCAFKTLHHYEEDASIVRMFCNVHASPSYTHATIGVPNKDFYSQISDSFDAMIKSIDNSVKILLASEDYEKVPKVHQVKQVVESYKEKLLDNIIEHKGKSNKPVLSSMLTEMVTEVSDILPELGYEIHLLMKSRLKE